MEKFSFMPVIIAAGIAGWAAGMATFAILMWLL
jgi:hypothetical protein